MIKIHTLRTEYRICPQGMDVAQPRFFWKLDAGSARNVTQQTCRVWVETASGRPVWDTGYILSSQLSAVYAGPALEPLTAYRWRVSVRVAPSQEEAVSDWAAFSTGKLGQPWQGAWISAEESVSPWAGVLVRRGFTLGSPVASAILVASAQGWYVPYLNGSRVGESYFAPGWTVDAKRIPYQSYDVTALLRPGENRLGAALGKGFSRYDFFEGWGETEFNDGKVMPQAVRPGFLAELHIRYEDGREEVISTDRQWEWAPSPVTYAHLYMGEHYDARQYDPAWCMPGDGALTWRPAIAGPQTSAVLTGAQCDSARVMETLEPAAILHTPKGETVVDMGQNMVGWVRLRVCGQAGEAVRLRFFEVLDQEGNVYTENLRKAQTTLCYTLRGEGEESYAPSFTYFGFRYIHVEAWPQGSAPAKENFTGEVVYAAMERTGDFTCSHPLVNRLFLNTLWGQKGNFVDVPTDCPQRDERLGWTGDAQVFARTAAFNMQVDPFFTKWLADLALDQSEEGDVPYVIPNVLGETVGSAAWGDAAVICPWTMYLCYGDTRLLETQYPSMRAWVDHILATGADPYRWDEGFHFGDWLSLDVQNNASTGSTDCYLVAQAMFAHSAELVSQAAKVLGRTEDADHYAKVAKKVRKAFRKEYLTPNGRLAVPTQTAHVLALMFGLVKRKQRPRLLRDLVALIEKKDYHLATGFVGTPYLCHVLSQMGCHDIAARVFLQEDYPSWLYPVRQGATTIWERWDGIKPDGSFQDAGMNSFNHYAYGSICDWLVQEVAGLDVDPDAPGYRHAVLHPRCTPGFTWARARYDAVAGEYTCGWSTEGGLMQVEVVVPAGATATLLLDNCPSAHMLMESGKPAIARQEMVVTPLHNEMAQIRVDLGSGTYCFTY